MDRRLPALAPLSAAVRPIAFDLMAARRQLSIDLGADVLLFYSPKEIEAIARSLQAGFHRPAVLARGELEHFEDDRDSEAIRVAAYSGPRLGELLALRWRTSTS
jgi:integrase